MFLGAKINPVVKKMQQLKVFNNSTADWECSSCECSSDISVKWDKVAP